MTKKNVLQIITACIILITLSIIGMITSRPNGELALDSQHCPEWMKPAFTFQDKDICWSDIQNWMEEIFEGHETVVFKQPVSEKFKKVAIKAAENSKIKLDI